MTPRAAKVCSRPGCPHLQPCPDHPKIPWQGSTRRARLPRGWETIRRRILLRDPICRVCNGALSTEVDHVEPGDDHTDENLQGICEDCHRRKTQAEARTARNR
jgi:5-methylcytosine-specific restriction protein A